MNAITSSLQKSEKDGLSKCASWRAFWKWPEFRSLTHHAMLSKKEPAYFENLMTELELAERVGGPSSVRAIIFQHRKELHEADWDAG